MDDNTKLSGTVTEDAVPLTQEQSSAQSRSDQHYSQALSDRSRRPMTTYAGSQQAQERITLEPVRQQTPTFMHGSSPGSLTSLVSFESFQTSEDEAKMEKDVVKGVEKAINRALSPADLSVQNPSLPSSISSAPASLELSTESLSLSPSVNEKDLKEYRQKFPDNIKVDYYDAMIVYQEDDRKLVQSFLDRVNSDVMLNKVEKPKLVLYDEILPHAGMQRIAEVDKSLEYCTYVFLYVTKKFCEDKWTEFAGQTALMNAIDSLESRWSVVPIFTEPKRNPTFKIPPSIRSLKGIQYWNDDKFYVDSLRKLLEDKLHVRLENEKELKKKRIQFIKDDKIKKRREAQENQQEERQRQQLVEEEERKHKERLDQKDHHFQQGLMKKKQQKATIQIPDITDDLNRFRNQNQRNNPISEQYLNNMRHDRTWRSKSGSVEETHGQRGMPELLFMQASWSYPTDLGKQTGGATFQRLPAFMPSQQHQRLLMTPQGRIPEVYPSQRETTPLAASGILGFSQAYVHFHPKTLPVTPDSSSLTCLTAEQSGSPDDGRNLEEQCVEKDKCANQPSYARGETPTVNRNEGQGNLSESSPIEKTAVLPNKDDLEEDIPSNSRDDPSQYSVPHLERTRHVGAPQFSEAVQHPPVSAYGPAHRGSSRLGAEPDRREDYQCDPRLAYSGGTAGVREGYSGYRPLPQEFQPSAYTQQIPSVYRYPYHGQFPLPRFYTPSPFHFQGYPGYFSHQGYRMLPGYETDYFPPQPPAHSFVTESVEIPFFPGQESPRQSIPVSMPVSQLEESQPPPTSTAPAVVHHHHYHHGSESGSEGTSTTINYFSKAENVMLGQKISVEGRGRTVRRLPSPGEEQPLSMADPSSSGIGNIAAPASVNVQSAKNVHMANRISVVNNRISEHPPTSSGEQERPPFRHDRSYEPERQSVRHPAACNPASGEQQLRSEEMMASPSSVSMNPPSEYHSCEMAFSEEHQNPSQLTQNVSRDNQSRPQLMSVPSSGPAAMTGLPELYAGSFRETPFSSRSSLLPLQAQPQGGVNPSTGHKKMDPTPGQWTEEYEMERETKLKRIVMGPTADESFPSEDFDTNTATK